MRALRTLNTAALIVSLFSACASNRISQDDYIGPPFLSHPNPAVAKPAAAAGIAGGIVVGIPLTVASLPVTVPMAFILQSNMFPVWPVLISGVALSTSVGAVTWPFFGWWKPKSEPDSAPSAACAPPKDSRESIPETSRK